jgi:hypothetical protein
MEITTSWVKPPNAICGLDHLAVQAPCINLYRKMLPGVIHDEEGRRAVIEIDDKEFTLEEFGTMLTTFSGWGMRIVFVPEDELAKQPDIVIKDPQE